MFLIMNLHKSLPGAETEAAVFLTEAVLSTSRTSKQGQAIIKIISNLISDAAIIDFILFSQRTLSPFCNVLQNVGPPVRTCSVDRDLFTECSLIEFLLPEQVPLEFQVKYHLLFCCIIILMILGRYHDTMSCHQQSPCMVLTTQKYVDIYKLLHAPIIKRDSKWIFLGYSKDQICISYFASLC